jgi:hypothetical protein
MKILMSPILMSIAIAATSLGAALPAKAADLSTDYSTRARTRYVVAPALAVAWWANRPGDILYQYAPEYPGWRGNAYYASCRSVSVREIMPDGTIVVRRRWAC